MYSIYIYWLIKCGRFPCEKEFDFVGTTLRLIFNIGARYMACTPSPLPWGEGGLKILEKSLLGGGQKFLFWYVWGVILLGERSCNVEVKIEIA